jgi:sigma-54 dependent transcriptional regulator, acetoin dehydrogenase operon transcriptional activator AcoR
MVVKTHSEAIPETAASKKEDRIKTAWEEVVLEGKNTRIPVKKEILGSWKKCLSAGLDPFSPPQPETLERDDLEKLHQFNSELIKVSKPILEMLEISVRGTGFITTLSEKNGYVLEVQGDRDVLTMAQRNYYLPGCMRSSEYAGTNGIGLCLELGTPIQLTGAEHFNINHHQWTCSSAPIRNGKEALLGVITLSGRSLNKHKHTFALVKAAAVNIESLLRERELGEDTHRLNYMLTSIYDSVSDGIIATNDRYRITHVNSAAEKLIKKRKAEMLKERLQSFIEFDENLQSALERGEYLDSCEINFKIGKGYKPFICQVDPIYTKQFKLLGRILTISAPKKMISIAKQIGGNYAKYEFSDIKGQNSQLQQQIELAKTASKTNSKVLIMGESGTGKELFAQAIHNHSHRSQGPFVAISCAAIPRDLIESELFGYKGGAFTGARQKGMIGKFELANGGTLFLDEINGLPLQLQGKLLRVLQQNEIMRLGDSRNIPIDVRIITASNTDLIEEVDQGHFREDLYYRLNVIEILIPPLRERTDDLEVLITHILKNYGRKLGASKPIISPQALEKLRLYNWPGNIRELENLIERALLLSQGDTITDDCILIRHRKSSQQMSTNMKTLEQYNKEMILVALSQSDGNIAKAARILKIARSTLYRKMSKFGIN